MNTVYLAPNATLVGEIRLEEDVNIWYGAVLRGDSGLISVGRGTNIQDNCVLHEATSLGRDCTVGHGAILHGCTLGRRCTVGMGAVVLTGAVIGDDCLIAAGALVPGGIRAPAGSLLMGNPARVVRPLTGQEVAHSEDNAARYVALARKSLPMAQWN